MVSEGKSASPIDLDRNVIRFGSPISRKFPAQPWRIAGRVLGHTHLIDRFTRLFEGPVEVTPPRQAAITGANRFLGTLGPRLHTHAYYEASQHPYA
jgi:hypothetical protein